MKSMYTLVLLLVLSQLAAQDPHFSTYTNSPLSLSPALTGQMSEGANRISVAYRGQWQSVLGAPHFRNFYAAYDRRFCGLLKGDYAALGLSVQGDERGSFPLQRADVKLSGAYMKKLTGNNASQTYLGLGVEGGAIHQRIGGGERTYDNQFTNPGDPGELLDQDNFTVLDYGVGLMLYTAASEAIAWSYYLGAAAKHLGKPEYNFLTPTSNEKMAYLESLYVLQVGGAAPLSNAVGLSMSAILMDQQPFRQLNLRVEGLFDIGGETILSTGVGWRQVKGIAPSSITDAWVPSLGVSTNGWNLKMSYDANVSPLRNASNAFGAFELSFSRSFGKGGCDRVFCPGM